ncbi:hypothetical protein GCM10011351_01510 [Paraliobacillus quinghaiensis]|uniref:DUF302 domain-containing protein n=1 Tax=Paraliobacillus quinghaiensis TaxID=470815 RepID=A0A917WNT6_9BACI|nr:DUF302 domain-containing protein [Paraliobacillus quinghaiensis]GGM19367.1 hypothetical protein GCM10011351_01510 [Paraliobacillus quinghaiensis]
MFHYTVESNKTMQEAVQALEENLKDQKFGILWQFDIKETLNNKGIDFEQPYLVLEVCNPKEAANLLTKNQLVGYFLPCKIVLYQDEGKTKIGMPKPTSLIDLVDEEELVALAQDIENKLINAIEKSK